MVTQRFTNFTKWASEFFLVPRDHEQLQFENTLTPRFAYRAVQLLDSTGSTSYGCGTWLEIFMARSIAQSLENLIALIWNIKRREHFVLYEGK